MAGGHDDQNQRCAVYSLWRREGPERKPRGGVPGAAQKRAMMGSSFRSVEPVGPSARRSLRVVEGCDAEANPLPP